MGGYDNKPASSSFWVLIHGKIVVLWRSRVDVDIEMEECMCFDGASGQSEVGMAATMTTSSWASGFHFAVPVRVREGDCPRTYLQLYLLRNTHLHSKLVLVKA